MATLREWQGDNAAHRETKIGCLQRIADGVEKMAVRHTELMDALADYKWRFEAENREVKRWANRCAAYKGIIKKLKEKKMKGDK